MFTSADALACRRNLSSMRMVAKRSGVAAGAGFTLIELLIVISIIGLLVAVLLPNIVGVSQAAKEDSTQALFVRIDVACKTFVNKHGYYPPDNFQTPEERDRRAGWKPDNGQNTGIESLLCFLSQGRSDGAEFVDLGAQLTNTDKDDHGVEMPLLKTRERMELADAWGMPLAYFNKFGMDKQQTVCSPEGDTQFVRAKKTKDGRPYGDGKYQLLSAGKDGVFGTDDDLVWPKN